MGLGAEDRATVEKAIRRQISDLAWRKIAGAMDGADSVLQLVVSINGMQSHARSSKRDLGIAWGILVSRFDLLEED